MARNFFTAIILFTILTSITACKKTQQCVDFSKVEVPDVCQNNYNPVCGCDDETYINECYARKNGVINWVGGPCLN